MPNKVLIIQYKSSEFMLDSLVKNLEKEGIDAVVAEPVPDRIAKERDNTDLFLLYAGDYITNFHTEIKRLRDYCISEEMPICVIGYDKDIALVDDIIPSYAVAYKFIRPFEMKLLIDKVKRLAAAPGTKGTPRSILLVDDDSVFLRTLLSFMSDSYNVTAVRSGQHALKYLKDHSVDLILLDYDMPVMSGTETLGKMRSAGYVNGVPVVFLTGVSDRESVVSVMQMKPDGYLLKNLGKDELLESVHGFFLTKKWKDNM